MILVFKGFARWREERSVRVRASTATTASTLGAASQKVLAAQALGTATTRWYLTLSVETFFIYIHRLVHNATLSVAKVRC